MSYRILVCGGRSYSNYKAVFGTLDLYKATHGQLVIIQGGANGADRLAREWCMRQPGCHLINEPAEWSKWGAAAGPIRNRKMLELHKPDLVIAFPGGSGTAHMAKIAREAGVTVYEPFNLLRG